VATGHTAIVTAPTTASARRPPRPWPSAGARSCAPGTIAF